MSVRRRKPLSGQPGLPLAERREGRLHGALETLLDYELGLAVAEQD
jgi:hypothetical protein